MIRRAAVRATAALAVAALAALTGPAAGGEVRGPGDIRAAHVSATAAMRSAVGVEAGIILTLRAYGPSVVTAGDDFSVAADVTNVGSAPAPGLRLEVRLTQQPLSSRARLAAFLASPDFSNRGDADPALTTAALANTRLVASRPVTQAGVAPGTGEAGTLPAGGTEPVTVSTTAARLALPAGESGVYGVVIVVTGPDGVVASHAAPLTWYDGAIPALPLAMIATAAGSPERVARIAAASALPGVAIAVDPTVFANGAEAEAIAQSREVFVLPSGAPDLRSLAQAGDEELIDFALTDATTHAPASLEDLPWLAIVPSADTGTVAFAAEHGAAAGLIDPSLGGPARTGTYAGALDIPITAAAEVEDGAEDAADGEADLATDAASLRVLSPEPGLSAAVSAADSTAADAPARVTAEAALAAVELAGNGPVVVAPGADWQLGALGVSPLMQALVDAPWVISVSVGSVLRNSQSYSAPAQRARSTRDMPAADIAALTRRLDRLDSLSLTAATPDDILVPGARTLLAPLAMGLRGNNELRDATLASSLETVDATLGSLRVPDSSDVNLIAASGNLPVTVYNDLPVDATVRVVVKSTSPNLRVLEWPTVTVPAGESATARVPVTAVSSANIAVTVALENARSDAVAPPQLIRIRVRADWGNAMAVVFTVGILVLLAAGVIRTVRRGRSGTRLPPAGDDHG